MTAFTSLFQFFFGYHFDKLWYICLTPDGHSAMTLCNHGGQYWLGLANHTVPITKLFLSEGSTIIHYVVLVLLMITNADTKDHYSPCSMF